MGAGPYPTEIFGDLAEELREVGAEYGTTTGRPRRIGWLDLVALKYASRWVLCCAGAAVVGPANRLGEGEGGRGFGAGEMHVPDHPPELSWAACHGSCRINGLTHINLTKLDVLSDLAEIKVR